MIDKRNYANTYVKAIVRDIQNAFVREETTSFSESKIEREYEFEDGAVVKYEWQDEATSAQSEPFNHRFTLIKLPSPNEYNLQIGVIKNYNYPQS